MAPRDALRLSSSRPDGGTPVGIVCKGPATSGEVRKYDPFLAV